MTDISLLNLLVRTNIVRKWFLAEVGYDMNSVLLHANNRKERHGGVETVEIESSWEVSSVMLFLGWNKCQPDLEICHSLYSSLGND